MAPQPCAHCGGSGTEPEPEDVRVLARLIRDARNRAPFTLPTAEEIAQHLLTAGVRLPEHEAK